jgi:hypothetical protein
MLSGTSGILIQIAKKISKITSISWIIGDGRIVVHSF